MGYTFLVYCHSFQDTVLWHLVSSMATEGIVSIMFFFFSCLFTSSHHFSSIDNLKKKEEARKIRESTASKATA